MALQFPNSPTHGQSYQTGSSATYIYNSSGSFWALEIGVPTTPLYASLSQSVADRITTEAARISTLETNILGYELKGRNLVSGSSQLTGSLNLLYAASGAVGGVSSYTALTSIPVGIVSGSTQVKNLLPTGTISGSSQLTSSYDTRYTLSGSISAVPAGTISGSSQVLGGSGVWSGSAQLPTGVVSGSAQTILNLPTGVVSGSAQTILNLPTGTISGSSQLTSSYDGRYIQTGSFNTFTSSYNTWTSSLSEIGTLNVDYINAGRITSDQTGAGSGNDIIFNYANVSSGISLNTSTGVFTLTANKTYQLFAELGFSNFSDTVNGYQIYDWVDATTNTRLATTGIGAGVGENINRNTNEFNATSTTLIYTPTTNQTIKVRIVEASGTVTVRAGIGTKAIIQQINPSVALNQFSTLQVSGSLITSGSTTLLGAVNVGTGSGFEGGEIDFAYAQSGSTTLTGSAVVFDVYADKMRLFENGGTNRGVYVDLSKAPGGVGGELMWKASGLVNAGTDVTLGNLKVRMSTSGNRSLQVSTITGTYSVVGSSVYNTAGPGGSSITDNAPLTITTTPTYLNASYTFSLAGYTDTWLLMSSANTIAWRINVIVGVGYNNNMISIERLV